jgi:hypothetical protein
MDVWRFDEWGLDKGPALTFLESGDVRHEFMTWLGPGVLDPKVEGFLASQEGEVIDAADDRFRIRLGKESRSLWSRGNEEVPVELTLTINRQTRCVRGMTHVIAEVHPLDPKLPRETLEARCSKLARDLRYCFFGQDLQLETVHTPKPGFRPVFSAKSKS